MSYKEQTTESLIRKMGQEPPILKNYKNWSIVFLPIFAVISFLCLLSFYPLTNRFIHIPSLFPDFLWVSVICFYSFWILFLLRFPEESFSKRVRFPLVFASLWILYSIGAFGLDRISGNEISIHIGKCWIFLLISSILFTGHGIAILRLGKPGNPILAVAILSVFSLAFANFCLKFVCNDQNSFHILVSHACVSLGLFIFYFFAFKNILKW
ncbi:NrsF family protein [Leptospira santarosai]|uniref:NrsF family protein n=1 Tax=Leptospira santarosai TaxID=28183 RepID=UPI0024AFF487|nr:NrsF family protein [Leptospira santarosai]MDI7172893.1 NrsF family protein [Leptospira santarosai]MDI7191938.1 NrsF family protein [Leptospira santarosai]MDO6396944.1 NrsF family protein [Leptospira santarosai]MDO6401778.1 NrsF family protein [Leptospira santarosai]